MDSTTDTRWPLFRGLTLGVDEQTEICFSESVRRGDPETTQLRLGGYGYESVLIWTNRSSLRRLAELILEYVDRPAPDVTTALVEDLVAGDVISVPDWPDERCELVTRNIELAPGFHDVHVETGERFTWPALHAVTVRLPRQQRDHAVPCRGLHDVAARPPAGGPDGFCDDCRTEAAVAQHGADAVDALADVMAEG